MRRMIIDDPDELDAVIAPWLRAKGKEVPQRGCYAAAVEFNEQGAVIGAQLLQNAIFLEGMYADEPSVSLLALHQMAVDYATKELGAERVMTFTRQDATGERIARCAKRLGYEQLPFNVFRRTL
jgi:hypothetical protein